MKKVLIAVASLVGLLVLAGLGFYLWGASHVKRVEAVVLREHDVSKMPDGEYAGVETFMTSEFEVSIGIANGRIVEAVAVRDDGREYAEKAKAVLEAVVEKQAVTGVDAVSGATIASKVFLNAAQYALERAAASRRTDP